LICAGALLVQACVQLPQSAEEFRSAVPGAAMMKTETYEVSRALADVAASFRDRAPECLNVSVRTTSHQVGQSFQSYLTHYRATVLTGKERAELHVQQLHEGGGVIYPSEPPPGGVYMLVLDAYAEAPDRTRIRLYGPAVGYGALYDAIRRWAIGVDLHCPDMTNVSR
jgi:hypothetical protein